MAKFTPVEGDPFAKKEQRFTPVENDPFAPPEKEGFFSRLVGGVKEAVTGSERNPQGLREFDPMSLPSETSIPRIIASPQQQQAFAHGNPLAMAEIFQKNYPDQDIYFDENGQPTTKVNGEMVYLNRPGMSRQDLTDIGTQSIGYLLGGAMGAKAGNALLGGFGRILGSGVGAGSASLLGDAGAAVSGSTQGVDQQRAATIAGLSVAGEAGASLLAPLLRSVLSSQKNVVNGQLTERGRQVLIGAGIDPDAVTPAFIAQFAKRSANAADAAAAARVAQAETLPNPVNLSRGQATQNPTVQTQERRIADQVYGDGEPSNAIQDLYRNQDAALRSNLDEVVPVAERRIGGGAGGTADDIKLEAERQKARVDQLYKAARNTQASAPGAVVENIIQRSMPKLEEAGILIEGPVKARLLALQEMSEQSGDLGVKMQMLDAQRKMLGNLADDAYRQGNKSTATGLNIIKRELDNSIQEAFNQSLIMGDAAAIEAWKSARLQYRQFAQNFKDNDIIKKIVSEELTPEQSANLLFNLTALGNRPGAVGAVRKVEELFGRDSKAFMGLKEEAFMRLLNGQPSTGFSAAAYRKAYDKAIRESRSMMEALFTTEELVTLRQVAQVSDFVVPMQGTTPLGSSHWNIQTIKEALNSMFGGGGRWLGEITSRWAKMLDKGAYSAAKIRGLAENPVPTRPLIPVGAGAGGAAAVGSQ